MKKESLAIISSYDELCGNASYTKALERELSHHFNVTVLGLDVELLRKENYQRVKHHIQNLCEQLKTFDCVNIQLEAGLFGSKPSSIRRNFFALAKASKRVVITMHRYQSWDRYPGPLALVKNLFYGSLREYIKTLKQVFSNNRHVPFYSQVVRFCKQKQIPIIIHTKRDKRKIELDFNYDKVFDHPLGFYSQNEIQQIRKQFSKESFYQDLKLNKEKKYIGIFGFINKYKGHETAIRSLRYLPDHYELLICGSQHPHTIQLEEPINPYIEKLLKLINSLGVSKRVQFLRLSTDEDFLKALIHCDYNVLPYLEVLQGGSAIAALSLETNSKVLFSQNLAFFELEKYAPDGFKMFTIGNYMELACGILNYDSSKYAEGLRTYHEKYNIHTSGLLYRDLLNRAYLKEPRQIKEQVLEEQAGSLT